MTDRRQTQTYLEKCPTRPYEYQIASPASSSLSNTHLESVVGPGAELHDTGLFVEGEVLHVDLTRGFVDGRRLPLNQAIHVERRLGGESHFEVPVSTTRRRGEEEARQGVITRYGRVLQGDTRYYKVYWDDFKCVTEN